MLTNPHAFVGTDGLFATLAKAREQLTFGIDPSELRVILGTRGLDRESDVGAGEYRQRYFKEAARGMRGHEFYRVALARVNGAETVPRDTPSS